MFICYRVVYCHCTKINYSYLSFVDLSLKGQQITLQGRIAYSDGFINYDTST